MKKLLSVVIALAFVVTATAVLAEETKATPKKEEVKVKVEEKTAEGKVKATITEKGDKTTVKVTEPGTKIVVKRDYKAECLNKFKGKTEKDADVQKCINDAKNADEQIAKQLVKTEEPAKAPAKATETAKKNVEKKAAEQPATK